MRSRTLLLALVVAGCGPGEPFQARFAVRGRWEGPRAAAYRVEDAGSPLAAGALESAVARALAEWGAAGGFAFRPAAPGEEGALVFAWKRGAHGACLAFGPDPSVSHAGPVGPGSFVHFDAARAWGTGALDLHQAALHEVGHVLGLDHTLDEEAVMHPDPSPARARLAHSDRAALHSLYGGGADARGDLVVTRADGSVALALRAVAPPEIAGWTTLDVDRDGAEEVLVWRTDAAGGGALWTFRFAPGPALARTRGPEPGLVLPGVRLAPARDADGAPLLVVASPAGPPRALAFDGHGAPRPHAGPLPELAASAFEPERTRRADLDGDGAPEELRLCD